MRILDISMIIHNKMQVYKNNHEKRPVFEIMKDFPDSGIRESLLRIELHTGTHIDAPLHMIPDGKTIDSANLGLFITKCRVIDLILIDGGISEKDLLPFNVSEGEFILLKTRNSYSEEFDPDFIYLAETGAKYLANKKIKGIGIDSLGIERSQPGHPTHKILLGAGIPVLEGLRLSRIDEGEYTLIALPLKIAGAEASPVRAVLIEGTL